MKLNGGVYIAKGIQSLGPRMVTLVYLVYELFPLFDFCISQRLCHFILESFFIYANSI